MRVLSFLIMLLLVPAVISAQPADWHGSIETKNGVVTIHNPKEGLQQNGAMEPLPLTRQFSIGYYEGPDNYLFTFVRTVTVAKNGDIYALDKECVRVFDKNGRHLFNFGRKGEGPGEFKIGIDMVMDEQGNIYLRDSGIQRVSVFNAAGKFLHSFRPESYSMGSIEIGRNGDIFYGKMVDYKLTNKFLIERYDKNGKLKNRFVKSILIMKKGPYGRPKYSWFHFKLHPDGGVIGVHNYPYRIERYDANDRLTKVILRDSPVFSKPVLVPSLFKTLDNRVDKIKAAAMRASVLNIFVLPDGKFFLICKDNGKNYKDAFRKNPLGSRTNEEIIDLFDRDGYFLTSYVYDRANFGTIMYIDRDGYLYTNQGEKPFVPGVTKCQVDFK